MGSTGKIERRVDECHVEIPKGRILRALKREFPALADRLDAARYVSASEWGEGEGSPGYGRLTWQGKEETEEIELGEPYAEASKHDPEEEKPLGHPWKVGQLVTSEGAKAQHPSLNPKSVYRIAAILPRLLNNVKYVLTLERWHAKGWAKVGESRGYHPDYIHLLDPAGEEVEHDA